MDEVASHKKTQLSDILLYPFSSSGLTILGIYLIYLVSMSFLEGYFRYIKLAAGWLIGIMFIWYLAQCVRYSTIGEDRAPDITADLTDWQTMKDQVLEMIVCYLIYGLPVIIYYAVTNKTDIIFWSLLIFGIYFFPISLLSVIWHDSLYGLNPSITVVGILKLFLPYTLLLTVLLLISFGIYGVSTILNTKMANLLGALFIYYILMIFSNMLGRFYRRYEEKLNW